MPVARCSIGRLDLGSVNSSVGVVPCINIVCGETRLTAKAKVTFDGETFTISASDLRKVVDLGSGAYGRVEKVIHTPSQRLFAAKYIPVNPNITDLRIGMCCRHPSVINYYCGLLYRGDIIILMELMDTSLDVLSGLVHSNQRIFSVNVLSYIVRCVVEALEYVRKEIRVMHRDVKPSNMLTNQRGDVKVCDFGISGYLQNSCAPTNIGTSTYLAPERIIPGECKAYRIHSDVWSLGLSVLELATGRPGYEPTGDLLKQLRQVVDEPSPRLPENSPYPDSLREFIDSCLIKKEESRPNYLLLLESEFLSNVNKEEGQKEMSSLVYEFFHPNP